MSTTTAPRAATAALVGGALWALLPVAWSVADVDDVEFGTLSHAAVAASYWIFAVLPPALIVAGLVALRRSLGPDAGRVGTVGLIASMAGLAAMSLGIGIEVASISFGGGEVSLGHALLLIGFLVHVAGSVLLGIVVFRKRQDGLSRTAGMLLTFAVPIGIGIGALGSALDPDNDAWFWAAISTPTAIAWVLLGASLRTARPSPVAEFATAS
jgi:hypothetical protein